MTIAFTSDRAIRVIGSFKLR